MRIPEHNRMPARQIIVYGRRWSGDDRRGTVRRFRRAATVNRMARLPVLLQQLRRKPEAIRYCVCVPVNIFFCLFPRQILPDYPVMIISDELFFSDRVVLKVYGGIRRCWSRNCGDGLSGGGGVNSGPGAHACAGQERWTPFVISGSR